MPSRSKSFGPTAATADTKTTIGSAYKVPQSGVLKKARVSAYNGVADKAGTAILYIESDQQKGPFEFAVMLMCGLTDVYPLPTAIVDLDIAVTAQEELTISLKASEALEDCIVSLTWMS